MTVCLCVSMVKISTITAYTAVRWNVKLFIPVTFEIMIIVYGMNLQDSFNLGKALYSARPVSYTGFISHCFSMKKFRPHI